VTLSQVVLARAASTAIIAFALLRAIFVVAVAAFHVHVSSIAGFLGMALRFGWLTASFGLLIAAVRKTPEAAHGIAMFATLIMVMLGGAVHGRAARLCLAVHVAGRMTLLAGARQGPLGGHGRQATVSAGCRVAFAPSRHTISCASGIGRWYR
jgi:hypothetical protein